jgi:hypothetical protein
VAERVGASSARTPISAATASTNVTTIGGGANATIARNATSTVTARGGGGNQSTT